MWGEKEMVEQTNEAKRAEAAAYLFYSSVHMLEENGWVRTTDDVSNPWYWWRNATMAEGSCSIATAIRYEHIRQNRAKPMHLVGDSE